MITWEGGESFLTRKETERKAAKKGDSGKPN
jgi:hypothetical protein